jgi:hypothetical protein
MPNITTFNTSTPYIYLSIFVTAENGSLYEFDAIFDTGAPRTEFSDTALQYDSSFHPTSTFCSYYNFSNTSIFGSLNPDFELDQSGHLISGVIARHSVDKDEVYRLPALEKPSAFKYTGTGFISKTKPAIIKTGLQSQKYDKIIIPQLQVCGHSIENLEVFVSHFENSWGIDALIGLDFLRRYKVEIDYKK